MALWFALEPIIHTLKWILNFFPHENLLQDEQTITIWIYNIYGFVGRRLVRLARERKMRKKRDL